jgi:DUF1680 family protein
MRKPRRPAPSGSITIHDDFWSPRLDLLRVVTLPALLDHFGQPGADAFRNFDLVAAGATGGHQGFPWYDGLVYETITAASRLLKHAPDPALRARLDGYIRRIAAAQAAGGDGYLATYTMLMAPDKRWGENGGNLRWQHDVYNAGCLVEAGVAHYLATGERSLLGVAVRLAGHLCDTMGPPPRRNVVPAHPLPEYALLDLHRLFVEEPRLRGAYPSANADRFLALARFWIDARGTTRGRPRHLPRFGDYAQDHEPVVHQQHAVGHAVRATLLYAGLVGVGRATGRRPYLAAARRLWKDVTTTKMAVTGGVGALQEEEMFGPAYFLPQGAHLETCAAVGMAYWSHGMSMAFGEGTYADVFERALYNNALAGVSLDGKRFFYRNPLESQGSHHRWDWHPCPCCPPMLLKLVSNLGRMAWSLGTRSIAADHYVAGTAVLPLGSGSVTLRESTGYPWDGRVGIRVELAAPRTFSLLLRIPGWCSSHRLGVNGAAWTARASAPQGYVAVDRRWQTGDTVELVMDMPITLVEANPYVEDCRGKAVIQRGPLVYCVEEADNSDVAAIRIPAQPSLSLSRNEPGLDGALRIRGKGADGRDFIAIPYFSWDNRSQDRQNRMAVWIPRDGTWDSTLMMWSRAEDMESWEGRLYRVAWSEATGR